MILIFLGSFRSTFAIFLSIPLSILAGAFGLYFDNQTINIMTLGGFALAIGRLVDDSVVVLENINRHLAMGKAPHDAAREGAEEVALAVLASTMTTVIVFFPVMFLFGVTKYLFSALALAVVLSMMASYVMAMTVIPIYCARFLSAARRARDGAGRAQPECSAPSIAAYERLARAYQRLLERALDHKWVVLVAISLLFAGTMSLYPRLGTELFPATDGGQFIISIRAPLGSRIEITDALYGTPGAGDSRGDPALGPLDDRGQPRAGVGLLLDILAQRGARYGVRDGQPQSRTIAYRPRNTYGGCAARWPPRFPSCRPFSSPAALSRRC